MTIEVVDNTNETGTDRTTIIRMCKGDAQDIADAVKGIAPRATSGCVVDRMVRLTPIADYDDGVSGCGGVRVEMVSDIMSLDYIQHTRLANSGEGVLVDLDALAEMIKSATPDDDYMEIRVCKGKLICESATAERVDDIEFSAGAYPRLRKVDSGTKNTITIPAADLLHGLTQTLYAVSDDETRYYLMGVCFAIWGKSLELVATDGARLAWIAMPSAKVNKRNSKGRKSIVPTPSLLVLKRILADAAKTQEEVVIDITDEEISFRCADKQFCSALVAGTYPDYGRVADDAFCHGKSAIGIYTDAAAMLDTVTGMLKSANVKKNDPAYIVLLAGMGVIAVELDAPNFERRGASVKGTWDGLKSRDGKPIRVGYEHSKFTDTMKALANGGDTKISMVSDANIDRSPLAIARKSTGRESEYHLLMPVRVAF